MHGASRFADRSRSMCIAAVEQYTDESHRLVQDNPAFHLLPHCCETCRTRIAQAADQGDREHRSRLWGNIICRKHYIDGMLDATVETIDAVVISQVLVGAGTIVFNRRDVAV